MGLDLQFGGLFQWLDVFLQPAFVLSLVGILAGFPFAYWAFDSYRQSRREGKVNQRDSMIAMLVVGILLVVAGLGGILWTVSG